MIRRWPHLLALLGLCIPLLSLPSPSSAGGGFTLSVAKAGTGAGSVTSSPAGIDCGSACAASFGPGTMVTLTADPNDASTFIGWKGDCSGAGDCVLTMDADHAVRAVFARSYRPDAWIKLCGLSTGCTVGPPPPHPWRGNGVYNTTAKHQTVAVRMEDGEGVRFWLTLENDGAQADTIVVQGCRGNRRFVINAVLVGKHKRPDWRARNVTKAFKAGTLEFSFPPSTTDKKVYLTLNIVAPTTAEGVTYRCPVTIRSAARPTVNDTVAGVMTTY
jgi:Divergent InlB B-repeat domain